MGPGDRERAGVSGGASRRGPLGAYFGDALLDTPMDYEEFGKVGGLLGHGGVVVFDDTVESRRAGAICV